jgi:hypothetical protein
MIRMSRLLAAASLLLVSALPLLAQTAPDPSGHWTGAIHVPPFNGAGSREVAVEIDLAQNAAGALIGTFSQPGQPVNGLPLSGVTADGRSISFEVKASEGGGVFRGTMTEAAAISGEFTTAAGGFTIPFDLKRTGDARIAPVPKSAAIDPSFEGTWNGALDVGGKRERIVLKMTNHPDGTSTGTLRDLDGSNVEIPIAITQQASRLTIDVAIVSGTYTGMLGGAGIDGTWKQGPLSLPLTFTRGDR